MTLLKQKWIRYFAFVLFVNVSTSAFALPKNEFVKIFYSDASNTVSVGIIFRSCSGRIYRQGKTTPYFTADSIPCRVRPKPPIDDTPDTCNELEQRLEAAEIELHEWQEMLRTAPTGQKSDIVAEIRRVNGEIEAIKAQKQRSGCS